jgi:hypothetical protein
MPPVRTTNHPCGSGGGVRRRILVGERGLKRRPKGTRTRDTRRFVRMSAARTTVYRRKGRGAPGPLEAIRCPLRSCWIRRHRCRARPCPGPSSCPAARGDGDGLRCRPCGRRRVLPRSSTRERCPSGAPLSRPCWQFRAAWPCPSMRIRDLPSPLVALLPYSTGETDVSGEPSQCNGSATEFVVIDCCKGTYLRKHKRK